jgi:hypothetical protein
MLLSTTTPTDCRDPQLLAQSPPNASRTERLMAVFGLKSGSLPRVDEHALAQYHAYLSQNLSWPFTAYYPHPTSPEERAEFCCRAVELLHPIDDMYDEFDGLFCKVRKGKYEVNLPLIELEIPENSPNYALIEDYWFWFWNWR